MSPRRRPTIRRAWRRCRRRRRRRRPHRRPRRRRTRPRGPGCPDDAECAWSRDVVTTAPFTMTILSSRTTGSSHYEVVLCWLQDQINTNPLLSCCISCVYRARLWWCGLTRSPVSDATLPQSPTAACPCRDTTVPARRRASPTSVSAGSTAPTWRCTPTSSPPRAATGDPWARAARRRRRDGRGARTPRTPLHPRRARQPARRRRESSAASSTTGWRARRPGCGGRGAGRPHRGHRLDDDHRGRATSTGCDDVRPDRRRPRATASAAGSPR